MNCSRACFVVDPSVKDTTAPKLPFEVGVPKIRPVSGSKLNPGGRPPAVMRAVRLAFAVRV